MPTASKSEVSSASGNTSSGAPHPPAIPIAHPVTGDEEWHALREVLASGWLTQGPQVAAFEEAFAARVGVPRAVAAGSCTAALHLALEALGIGPGDEVIVPAFTWVATANVVLYTGATPVLVDVDPPTYNMAVTGLEAVRTERTRAVIPVHLFGRCADIDAVARALPGVPIIEDAACAAGATYKGRPAGSLGAVGAFSFHPRKVMTTGEGGMLTCLREDLAERAAKLRNHGAEIAEEDRHVGPRPYLLPEFNLLGFNYRMTDLQAAVGLVQLRKLEGFIAQRQQGAEYYRRELMELDWLRTPDLPEDGRHAWQAFVCMVEDGAPASRDEILRRLHEQGIGGRPGTHAVHMLGYYRQRFGFRPEDFPVAREAARRSLALPLHNAMRREHFDRVVAALRGIR